MKFYTFGDKDNPVILLLPGTSCHWQKNFGEVIPLLERDFYVVCVSYDGFDETEKQRRSSGTSGNNLTAIFMLPTAVRLAVPSWGYWYSGGISTSTAQFWEAPT